MITIRYANLPEGLHAQAEARGRRTVIYLRPGLTPEQRRHGLRRARQSARMGYGPPLTAAGVALAIAGDSTRGTLLNAGAALRRHPVGSVLLAAGMATSVLCYVLFVTVSLWRIMPSGPHLPPVGKHWSWQQVSGGQAGRDSNGGPPAAGALGVAPSSGASPGESGGAPSPRGPSPAPSGTPTRTGVPTANPGGPFSPHPSSPSPLQSSPAPSRSPSPISTQLCLHIGSMGVCLPL